MPELRFEGFSGKWEERKLGEVAEFNPRSNLPDEFEYVDLESVVGTNLVSHRIERKETAPSRAQRLAKPGDVFYQMVRPYQKNNFLFDLPYDNFVFSTGYAQMRPNVHSYFLLTRLQEARFVSNVLDRSTGTSYPAINSNDLAQIEISVPKIKNEQTQIGNFFKQLDETIALHQQELDTLKQTKQGFLQKMFPKEGESVPEIRFPGFSREWEKRKLSDITNDIGTGKSTFTKHEKSVDYQYAILGSTSIIGYDNTFEYEGDFVLTARVGANAGNLYRYYGQVKITDNTVFIKSENLSFLYPLLNHFDLKKLSFGTGQPLVKASELKNLKIRIPSFEEQHKIGTFFIQLDDTIALQQKELDALKETKKAFLQKMFI